MKLPANVVDQLIQGVNSDIRQVLNMMSTWKLSSNTMDFDESKALYAGYLIQPRLQDSLSCQCEDE